MGNRLINMFLVFFVIFAGFSCGGGGGGSSSSSGTGSDAGSTSTGTTGTISGTISLADTVTLALTTGNALAAQTPNNVRVYVDDDETLYDDTDSSGNFSIASVPAGSKCIHASTTALNNNTYGFRKCDITVGAGDDAAIGTEAMTETGAISGTISLEEETDYQNVLVYVPGTSFDARTAADGTFTMTGLPAGNYAVAFEKDGFVSYEFASVTVESGFTTSIGSLTLLAGAGCTGNGAILAMTSISQSSLSADVGETVTFTIEACSSLGLAIDYEWYLGSNSLFNNGPASAAGQTFTFTPVAGQEGMNYTIYGTAFIDSNNVEQVPFYVKVNNDDYRQRVGSYTNLSPSDFVEATGKYGDYIYEVGVSATSLVTTGYALDIIDVSDPSNPTLIVDDQDLFTQEGSDYGVSVKFFDSKIFITYVNSTYIYDLAGNPLLPSLISTLSCAEEYCADHSVEYYADWVPAASATADQIAACTAQFPDQAAAWADEQAANLEQCTIDNPGDEATCLDAYSNVCIVQEQAVECTLDQYGGGVPAVSYSNGTAFVECADNTFYAYDVPTSGSAVRVGSLQIETQSEEDNSPTSIRDMTSNSGDLFLIVERLDENGSNATPTLYAYDFSDPSNPILAASYLTAGIQDRFVLVGDDRLYVNGYVDPVGYFLDIYDNSLSLIDSMDSDYHSGYDNGVGYGASWFMTQNFYGCTGEIYEYCNSTYMINIYEGTGMSQLNGSIDPDPKSKGGALGASDADPTITPIFADTDNFYVVDEEGNINVYDGL